VFFTNPEEVKSECLKFVASFSHQEVVANYVSLLLAVLAAKKC
jgi:hypothetical protein